MEINKLLEANRKLTERKRNTLFLRYVELGLVLCLFNAVFDYYFAHYEETWVDVGIILVLVGIYFIAYLGKPMLAKVLFLSIVHIVIFVLAALVPKEDGIYLVFFPLVTTLFTIFDVKQFKISYFFAFLSLAMLITLEVFDFRIFGDYMLETEATKHSFIINMTLGIIVVIFSVNFLVRVNLKTENHLQKNQMKLRKLTIQVQERNVALAKTNSELDRFVYSASHDLRAPLMSILGLVNLAEKDTQENQIEYLHRVKSQVKKLDDFIKDIISYSRNTRVQVKNEEIDFDNLINEILANLQFMEGAEKVQFRKNVRLKGAVISDSSRLSVILNNLISNAIKYHNFDQASPYIDIDISDNDDGIKIIVSDNGSGISETYHHQIFEMFVRASESSQGSGLGLYIVKEIVEKLGGKISLESEEGQGSKFIVDLPKDPKGLS